MPLFQPGSGDARAGRRSGGGTSGPVVGRKLVGEELVARKLAGGKLVARKLAGGRLAGGKLVGEERAGGKRGGTREAEAETASGHPGFVLAG